MRRTKNLKKNQWFLNKTNDLLHIFVSLYLWIIFHFLSLFENTKCYYIQLSSCRDNKRTRTGVKMTEFCCPYIRICLSDNRINVWMSKIRSDVRKRNSDNRTDGQNSVHLTSLKSGESNSIPTKSNKWNPIDFNLLLMLSFLKMTFFWSIRIATFQLNDCSSPWFWYP